MPLLGLLTGGVVTSWRARAHARPKAALLLSLIAAVPVFFAALGFLILSLGNSS